MDGTLPKIVHTCQKLNPLANAFFPSDTPVPNNRAVPQHIESLLRTSHKVGTSFVPAHSRIHKRVYKKKRLYRLTKMYIMEARRNMPLISGRDHLKTRRRNFMCNSRHALQFRSPLHCSTSTTC